MRQNAPNTLTTVNNDLKISENPHFHDFFCFELVGPSSGAFLTMEPAQGRLGPGGVVLESSDHAIGSESSPNTL